MVESKAKIKQSSDYSGTRSISSWWMRKIHLKIEKSRNVSIVSSLKNLLRILFITEVEKGLENAEDVIPIDPMECFEQGLGAEINAGGMRGQTKTLFKYMSRMYRNLRREGKEEMTEANWNELVKILQEDADAQIATNDPKVRCAELSKACGFQKKKLPAGFSTQKRMDAESVVKLPIRMPRFKQIRSSQTRGGQTTKETQGVRDPSANSICVWCRQGNVAKDNEETDQDNDAGNENVANEKRLCEEV
uniref:Uncharacterized protein n=1 Tax=Ditylenchus dipsaci TaxID=166011 RepID=A0A915CPH6_9BILA